MSLYLDRKYSAYSKVDKCFLRCMVEAELLCSEKEVMKLQHQIFGKTIGRMTYFQFMILVEAGLSEEFEERLI